MSGVNWNLGLAQDVGGNAFASFQKGQEQRRVDEGRNALTGYVTNPNDDTLKALAPHQPEFVLAQKQKQQQQAQEQEERQIIGDALTNPDPAIKAQARQRLAYTNSELYMKLDENQRKAVGEQMKSIGQLAFNLLQLPDDQIGPATDNALANMQTQGFDTSGFKRTGNPRQDLLTVLATTGQLDEWEKFSQPRYVPVGEQGLQGLQYGKPMAGGPMVNSSTQQKAPAAPPPPKEAIEDLRRNPKSAPQFDEIFGQGAAAKALGGASSNASGGFSGFKRAIIAQESGGRYGVTNAEGSGAMGVGQIMPETGAALAKREGLPWRPDLMRGNSAEARAYQDRLTDAALKEAWQYGGGDPEKAAKYYFAGPNQKGWGSKTRRYGADITRRMGAR